MLFVIQQAVGGLVLGAAYAIAGVTFGLLYRIMKVFHFAFGAIGISGTYLAVVIAHVGPSWTWLALGLLAGMLLAGLLTSLSHRFVYLPLTARGASSGVTFVSALGLGLIVEAGLVLAAGADDRPFELGDFARQHSWIGLPVSGLLLGAILVTALVTVGAVLYMRRTGLGRQTEALISNPEQAELVGIRTRRLSIAVCFVLGALSVLAFTLQGMNSTVAIAANVSLSLFGILAMLVGGIRNIVGTAIAGLAFGVVGNIAAVLISSSWATVITFALAMVLIVARPDGFSRKAVV